MWMVLGCLVFVLLVGPGSMQEGPPPGFPGGPPPGLQDDTPFKNDRPRNEGIEERMKRMSTKATKKKIIRRTTPPWKSFLENCNYLAFYCLKAYVTGRVCARTIRHNYYTFKNYCMMDYVNCMERYDIWHAVHIGECVKEEPLQEYMHYPYDDDLFLEQYYVIEDVKDIKIM